MGFIESLVLCWCIMLLGFIRFMRGLGSDPSLKHLIRDFGLLYLSSFNNFSWLKIGSVWSLYLVPLFFLWLFSVSPLCC